MPSGRCREKIRKITRSWVVPMGARRIEYLRNKGITIAALAKLGGGTNDQARAALEAIARDAKEPRKKLSEAARERLITLLEPAVQWWNDGVPAAEIADRLGVNVLSLNAEISRYRLHLDPKAFPKRIGTPKQHRPRLHAQSSTDSELHQLRLYVRSLARSGTKQADIAKLTGIGVPRIRRWVRGTDSEQLDIPWMRSHAQYLALARELWAFHGNHYEIALHYRITPGRMHLLIVQAQNKSAGTWFPTRSGVRTKSAR